MAIQQNLQQGLKKLQSALDSRHLNNPKLRAAFLIGATALFAVGIAISLIGQPGILDHLDWRYAALVVAIGIPITIWLNAIEFLLSGRLVGKTIPFAKALEITVIATAANMLPLPGGAIVRVAGLKAAGARYREGIFATLLIALIWVGVAFLYAGVWITYAQPGFIGNIFMVAGALVLVLSVAAAMWVSNGPWVPLQATLLKLAAVITDAARIYLSLQALGIDASFAQASALAVGTVVGSAISVVPAGLGVREAVSALLSPVVGLSAAVGFLSVSLNRILGLVTIVPVAAILSYRNRSNPQDAA